MKLNARIAIHRSSQAVVEILPPDTDAAISMMKITETPDLKYSYIGVIDIQKKEIREAI